MRAFRVSSPTTFRFFVLLARRPPVLVSSRCHQEPKSLCVIPLPPPLRTFSRRYSVAPLPEEFMTRFVQYILHQRAFLRHSSLCTIERWLRRHTSIWFPNFGFNSAVAVVLSIVNISSFPAKTTTNCIARISYRISVGEEGVGEAKQSKSTVLRPLIKSAS